MAITDVQLLFDKNPNPMLIYELDTQQVINANQAAQTLYGYTQDEIETLTMNDIELQEEDSDTNLHQNTDPDHDSHVQRHQTKQGKELYVNTFSNPIKKNDKNCKLVVVQNISKRVEAEQKYEKSQKILNVLIKQLPGTFFIIDTSGKMYQWNDNLEEMTGYTGKEIANMNGLSFFSPDDQPAIYKALQEVIEEGQTEIKAKAISKSGTCFPLLMKASKTDIDGEPYIVGMGIDVSSLEKTQEQLKQSNKKLKEAQDIAKVGYWTHNIKEDVSNWSDGVYNIYGMNPETTLTYQKWLKAIHPEDRNQYIIDADTAFPDGNFHDNEHRIIRPDGEVRWVLERVTLHRDANGNATWLEGITQDITEKKEKEEKVKEALEEKETLLMEIHHRVKNNLAIISGLMDLEIFESEDEMLKRKLRDSQARVNSIALTHEILYQQMNFSNIDFDKNIKQLVDRIMNIYQQEVQVIYELDPVSLNINQALPCSLMVNEILTNALKHAFEDYGDGVIEIHLKEYNDGEVYLSVSDNGRGIDEDFNLESSTSLGLHLIRMLKEQLQAELEVSTSNGTSYKVRFKKEDRKGAGSSLPAYSSNG